MAASASQAVPSDNNVFAEYATKKKAGKDVIIDVKQGKLVLGKERGKVERGLGIGKQAKKEAVARVATHIFTNRETMFSSKTSPEERAAALHLLSKSQFPKDQIEQFEKVFQPKPEPKPQPKTFENLEEDFKKLMERPFDSKVYLQCLRNLEERIKRFNEQSGWANRQWVMQADYNITFDKNNLERRENIPFSKEESAEAEQIKRKLGWLK